MYKPNLNEIIAMASTLKNTLDEISGKKVSYDKEQYRLAIDTLNHMFKSDEFRTEKVKDAYSTLCEVAKAVTVDSDANKNN